MGEGELRKSMSEMTIKMQTIQMIGNINKDFATMMISHYEDDISMSNLELKNGIYIRLNKWHRKK